MDNVTSADYLFDLSKEIKYMYESPVIFVTKEDTSDIIFNTICEVHKALLEGDNDAVINKIVDFHLKWLHTVADLEKLKVRVEVVRREQLYEAISFTIDALSNRLKYFKTYMHKYLSGLSNLERTNILADIELVEEMHAAATQTLLESLKCFRSFTDDIEFQIKVTAAADDYLIWLDKAFDSLSNNLGKYFNTNTPEISADLSKTLQQIVDDLHNSATPSALKVVEEMEAKVHKLYEMIRCKNDHVIEMSKVTEKIGLLDDRIMRMEQEESSAAVLALKNKKEFLEKRLQYLEILKTTLQQIRYNTVTKESTAERECPCEDYYHLRIFNHVLPPDERENLITKLCGLWNKAVFGDSRKSIISILSAADVKQEYKDDYGNFYIDEYSRKIYKEPENETLYQLNEINELVPLSDDENHIYFFDGCGRYFVEEKTRQRIYKAHANASEYMMDSSGLLLKVKEERDGVVYFYDSFGRYYINDEGKHIYREADSVSEYENDGLGNLVRIRSQLDIFELCPPDENVTEDFKYLKLTVGPALRTCLADVILYQPADPIKYLSARLIKYRENIERNDIMKTEREELQIERDVYLAEERAAAEKAELEAALLNEVGSEASYDSNLQNYESPTHDILTDGAISK